MWSRSGASSSPTQICLERFRREGPLNHYDRPTFYGGGARGYTDYPALADEPALA